MGRPKRSRISFHQEPYIPYNVEVSTTTTTTPEPSCLNHIHIPDSGKPCPFYLLAYIEDLINVTDIFFGQDIQNLAERKNVLE